MRSMTCMAATWTKGCSGDINHTVYNFVHKSQMSNCSSFYKGLLPSSGTDHVCYP